METIEIELIRIFCKVVKLGSFTKAADQLKLPKSTVSKSLSRLETMTGTRLMIRTTRSLSLTKAGQVFYQTCMGPVQVLEEAQKSLLGQDQVVGGLVRITAPEDLGTSVIAPAIGHLIQKYPDLQFELIYTNRVVDLVKEGFDFAIRIGTMPQSQLRMRKLGLIHMILVASPDYLKRVPVIREPLDLSHHVCLSLNSAPLQRDWIFKKQKRVAKVKVKSGIQSNQMSSLLRSVETGAGILMVPGYLCQPQLNEKSLVRVLPDWESVVLPVHLVSPQSTLNVARLKVVGEQIYQAVTSCLNASNYI